MKKQLFAIILLLAFQQGICQPKSLIKVWYVDFNILTAFSITCQFFEQSFEVKDYKQWIPKNKQQTDSLMKLLNGFKFSNWDGVDTRAKIEWVRNGKKLHYCFDRFGHFTDGKNIYTNNKLFAFLKKHLPIDLFNFNL